jgi:hypothetical protein
MLLLLGVAGLSVAGYLVVFLHLTRLMRPIPALRSPPSIVRVTPTKPACPTARLPDADPRINLAPAEDPELVAIIERLVVMPHRGRRGLLDLLTSIEARG